MAVPAVAAVANGVGAVGAGVGAVFAAPVMGVAAVGVEIAAIAATTTAAIAPVVGGSMLAAEVITGCALGAGIGGGVLAAGAGVAGVVSMVSAASQIDPRSAACCANPSTGREFAPRPVAGSRTFPAPGGGRPREAPSESGGGARGQVPREGDDRIADISLASSKDFEAASMTGAVVVGKKIESYKVPYKFSVIIARYADGEGKKTLVHAGILFRGDFEINGAQCEFMLVDRWQNNIGIKGCRTKKAALKAFPDRLNSLPFKHFKETPEHESAMPVPAMVPLVTDELQRELKIVTAATLEELLKDPKVTNCIRFAYVGAAALCKHDAKVLLDVVDCYKGAMS